MITLYTAGYRDAITDKRLPPDEFYCSLPEDAAVVDIRSNPYSPFAPNYTGGGVALAVERWKPGVKVFHHLRALGNTARDEKGKRGSPPVYVDPDVGFPQLEQYLQEYRSVVIFCACSRLTIDSETHRCHRFFVADTMSEQIPGLEVIHLPADEAGTGLFT